MHGTASPAAVYSLVVSRSWLSFLATVLGAVWVSLAQASEAAEAVSAVAQAGGQVYGRYCAPCHGVDARGNGPVAPELKTSTPDLTQMAARRNGAFPFDELARYIDGRTPVGAHGSAEMPVWGETFAKEYAGDADQQEIVRGTVLMLLVYLESIQR